MGETRVRITAQALSANGHAPVGIDTLADTGATLTLLPEAVLKQAGVIPDDRIPVILADGSRIERSTGHAWLTIEGRRSACQVIFGEAGDEPLLGLTALEQTGFAVDPVQRKLIPSGFKLL